MAPPRTRRLGLVTGLSLLALVIVLVGIGIWMALGALTAYERLSSAREDITELQQDVTDGNIAGIDARVASLRADTAEARDAVDTWAWRLAAYAPVLGDDVTALRTVVAVTDDLADGPAASLARAATTLTADALKPVDGRVPLEPLREAAPGVTAGFDGLVAARTDLGSLDTSGVAGPLADAVAELRGEVIDLVDRVALADRLVTLLPPMLGGDGPRRYLLLNQNTAEARSLGGIAGTAILVTANDGRIRLQRQVAGNTFGELEEPVLPLSLAEQSLYGIGLGTYFLNAPNTPDFPRAAELAAARWQRDVGQEVAGVLSVDPAALALLLRATGPVQVGGVELTADNAASLLLSGVYAALPDPTAQDEFFALAAKRVFDRLAAGRADVRVAAESLATAVEEGRLLLWSRRAGEQAELSGSPVAGELDGRDGRRPELGVYLFETTASKLSYYETLDVTTRPVCSEGEPDPSGDIAVRVEVGSQVPRSREARESLPDYVVAGSDPLGTLRTQVFLYAPPEAGFGSVLVDGEPVGIRSVLHDGLFVAAVEVEVPPGGTVVVVTRLKDLSAAAARPGALAVRTTPMSRHTQLTKQALDCP
ncbi:DUF4012 domain-containing protein [Nocardioidaceae bacterium]|nr:DUF4012 domain-containing protein [Nocardioidaceae bacterium]